MDVELWAQIGERGLRGQQLTRALGSNLRCRDNSGECLRGNLEAAYIRVKIKYERERTERWEQRLSRSNLKTYKKIEKPENCEKTTRFGEREVSGGTLRATKQNGSFLSCTFVNYKPVNRYCFFFFLQKGVFHVVSSSSWELNYQSHYQM